jgi:hypothetical protein
MDMRFCRHVPNSLRDKNKKLHNSCLPEKMFLCPPKLCNPPFAQGKKVSSTLNFMILQRMVRNECVRFGGHVDIKVNYKILQLKILKESTILDTSPCFQ